MERDPRKVRRHQRRRDELRVSSSPFAHLADGTTDLILVRKCSHLDFFRHLLRHANKDDRANRKLQLVGGGKVTFPPNSTDFGL